MTVDLGPIDRALELADSIARAWRPGADRSTTIARERALLRLAGVGGLDRDGRPLAWAVVDRYLDGHRERLGGGLVLPFAMAAVEYDLNAQDLALDVAGGAIDLGLETELLREPDRRAIAEAEATRFAETAFARIDANRTARRELVDVLGDAARPWVGATAAEPIVDDAIGEAAVFVQSGIDLVRVRVPAGRELIERLGDTAERTDPRATGTAAHGSPTGLRAGPALGHDVAPSGSQRGLARLRESLDEAAAERRAYVRLATVATPLAAPEQAVVAAFERVDVVEADPLYEIVAGGVDPDRALADHAFADRVHARARTMLLIGAGPLVVGPDIRRGLPATSATLAGRALAMQLLSVAFARLAGLADEQVLVGAMPAWIAEERDAGLQSLASVCLRRAAHPGHPLVFEEPELGGAAAARWPFLLAAALPRAGSVALVLRQSLSHDSARDAAATRAASEVAASVHGSSPDDELGGAALEHARAQSQAALETLETLRDSGWQSILGPAFGESGRLAADAAVERAETFDPFSDVDPALTR